MASNREAFARLIEEDRATHEADHWHGTFLDYLERVREDPTIPRLAHARVYDAIMSSGSHEVSPDEDAALKRLYPDEPVRRYDFFADEFFGIEKTVSQIVRFFHSAALKGEESRQVLYLMGPVGSGKSSLVEKIQRGLEESGSFYGIAGSSMHEEPLQLIPQ